LRDGRNAAVLGGSASFGGGFAADHAAAGGRGVQLARLQVLAAVLQKTLSFATGECGYFFERGGWF